MYRGVRAKWQSKFHMWLTTTTIGWAALIKPTNWLPIIAFRIDANKRGFHLCYIVLMFFKLILLSFTTLLPMTVISWLRKNLFWPLLINCKKEQINFLTRQQDQTMKKLPTLLQLAINTVIWVTKNQPSLQRGSMGYAYEGKLRKTW